MAEDLMRRMADELEIRALVTHLAALADDGDLDEYQAQYTEDAVWRMTPAPGQPEPPPVAGAANIRAASQARRNQGAGGPGSHTAHVIVVNAVAVDGDKAKAQSYMTFFRNTDTAPQPASMKRYRDEFVRTAHGWKLSSRTIESI